jgi:hypothetical protein
MTLTLCVLKSASPETFINEWSHGEVTKPDTLIIEPLNRKRWTISVKEFLDPKEIMNVLRKI